MMKFLEINKIEVNVSDQIIEEVMVDIATDKMSKSQLTAWLKKFSVSLK